MHEYYTAKLNFIVFYAKKKRIKIDSNSLITIDTHLVARPVNDVKNTRNSVSMRCPDFIIKVV